MFHESVEIIDADSYCFFFNLTWRQKRYNGIFRKGVSYRDCPQSLILVSNSLTLLSTQPIPAGVEDLPSRKKGQIIFFLS